MGTLAGATEGVFFLSLVSLIESKDVSKSVSELKPPRDKTDGGPWLKETWDILERGEGETARGLGGGGVPGPKGHLALEGKELRGRLLPEPRGPGCDTAELCSFDVAIMRGRLRPLRDAGRRRSQTAEKPDEQDGEARLRASSPPREALPRPQPWQPPLLPHPASSGLSSTLFP